MGGDTGCGVLGFMLERGQGGPEDLERARSLLTRTCQIGASSDACVRAGAMWMRGRGGPEDLERARTFFERACKHGNDKGCQGREALERRSP
jgi:hypothetical protein